MIKFPFSWPCWELTTLSRFPIPLVRGTPTPRRLHTIPPTVIDKTRRPWPRCTRIYNSAVVGVDSYAWVLGAGQSCRVYIRLTCTNNIHLGLYTTPLSVSWFHAHILLSPQQYTVH